MELGNGQFKFSVFSVDLQKRTLHRGHHKAALQEQAFRVLLCLIRQHGEVVTREVLSRELWGDSLHFDSDQAINRAVNQIRWCLGDSPKAARYIETLPRLGYRFVAPVEFLPADDGSSPAPEVQATEPLKQIASADREPFEVNAEPDEPKSFTTLGPPSAVEPIRSHWRRTTSFVVAALLILIVSWESVAHWIHRRAQLHGLSQTTQQSTRVSLMVVPIHAQPDLQEKADRLRYDLTDALGRVPEIRVPATHLFQSARDDADSFREILRDSKSDYLLMGELRANGDACTFNAELVRAAELTHIANIRIDAPSCQLPMLRERASYAVQHSLLGDNVRQDRSLSSTSRAYEAYLEGEHELYLRTNDSLERANGHFREAVALNPEFADGYAGMANVYLLLADRNNLPDGYSMAMRLARRAIAIKPSLALAHGVLGCATLSYERDWTAALRELELASELAPDEAVFHMWLSSFYSASGDGKKAVEQFKVARKADPLWPSIYTAGVLAYKNMEDFPAMLNAAQQLVKFAPDAKRAPEWMLAYQTEANALWLSQRYAEAVHARRRAAEFSRDPELEALETAAAAAFEKGGPQAYAKALVLQYNDNGKLGDASWQDAEWAIYANEPELALKILKVVARRRHSESINIPSDPVFRALRISPEYKELVSELR